MFELNGLKEFNSTCKLLVLKTLKENVGLANQRFTLFCLR